MVPKGPVLFGGSLRFMGPIQVHENLRALMVTSDGPIQTPGEPLESGGVRRFRRTSEGPVGTPKGPCWHRRVQDRLQMAPHRLLGV